MKRLTLALAMGTGPALAASPPDSLLGITLIQNKAGTSLGVPMQIVLLLTLLTLLPAILMSITPFLRITIVLHFLRQALGTQTTPSNQILIGLSMFLSMVILQPVALDIYHKGWEPMDQGTLTPSQAFEEGAKPLKTFLARFAREKDIKLFV